MEREVVWSAVAWVGTEHLRLRAEDDGVLADGVIVGVAGGCPFRIGYEVRCDAGWRVRALRVGEPGSGRPVVNLFSDGKGNWRTPDGRIVTDLEGCVDVDISATPFTNTLPIRRLGLTPGEAAEIPVVFVDTGEMSVRAEPQRYTCLNSQTGGGLYRFEALGSDFAQNPPIELPVDSDGLVLDYPDLFDRVAQ